MDISFTCTTSRRLKLFIRTLDSFLECCLDRDLIKKWLVSDDGSSDDEIKTMKKRYPFLEIRRSKGNGQAGNLNTLFDRVDTEYIIHCEDDWLFIKKGNLINDSIAIINDDERIKEVIFRGWCGVTINSGDLRYRLHYHHPHFEPHIASKYDARWLGYSLNPGVQHFKTIKKYLPYREDFNPRQQFWDRIAAFRYLKDGYKRASFTDNYIQHLG